jgi:hypothetical protein
MSLSVVVIGALVIIGIALWMFFGGEAESEEVTGVQASAFRCKICGKISSKFVDAHEHASADHDLAGQQIDESVEAQ